MRSTISPGCATARRILHDLLPSDSCAKGSAAPGCPQGPTVPQVPSHVPQRVGRRADLFSLQEHGRVAEGRTPAVPSCRQAPIGGGLRVPAQLAGDHAAGIRCATGGAPNVSLGATEPPFRL
jgi:hypothetical protein